MTYQLVDPRGAVHGTGVEPAHRPGKIPRHPRIGFLINEINRQAGPDFYAYSLVIEDEMRKRIPDLEVFRDCKPVLSRPADDAMLLKFRDCRGVVSGLAK